MPGSTISFRFVRGLHPLLLALYAVAEVVATRSTACVMLEGGRAVVSWSVGL